MQMEHFVSRGHKLAKTITLYSYVIVVLLLSSPNFTFFYFVVEFLAIFLKTGIFDLFRCFCLNNYSHARQINVRIMLLSNCSFLRECSSTKTEWH